MKITIIKVMTGSKSMPLNTLKTVDKTNVIRIDTKYPEITLSLILELLILIRGIYNI